MLPVNKTAALVTSKGFEYVPDKKIQVAESKNPIKTIDVKSIKNENFIDLSGRRRGRLVVAGFYGSGKWVVRCDCGTYTVRKTKAILNENNNQDRCEECRHLVYLKRNDYNLRTGKDKDINDF